MSELKSPFLNDTNLDNVNEKDNTAESSLNVHEEKFKNGDMDDLKFNNKEESGSLEIQEEGKTLRNIIIIMIILLALALLGLILYNLFNKSNEPNNNENLKKEINLEINDFDMKSKEFRARSVIVE